MVLFGIVDGSYGSSTYTLSKSGLGGGGNKIGDLEGNKKNVINRSNLCR